MESGRQIAASSYYLVERDPLNTSSASVLISRFDEADPGLAPSLNSIFATQRNSANPIDFLSNGAQSTNGALGVINNVDDLNNLTSIKTQSKLQFSENIASLDSSSQLVIKLNNVAVSYTHLTLPTILLV